MVIGCVICSEPFAFKDGPDNYAKASRTCGHVFHNLCLRLDFYSFVKNFFSFVPNYREWLKRSQTCPICRSAIIDSPQFTQRLHLQSVNNLDTSDIYETAKDEEIKDLRKQLAESRNTMEKLRTYFADFKKNLQHIEVELGEAEDEPIIDLSESSIVANTSSSSRNPVLRRRLATAAQTTASMRMRVGIARAAVAAQPSVATRSSAATRTSSVVPRATADRPVTRGKNSQLMR